MAQQDTQTAGAPALIEELRSPRFRHDPYPFYARLREQAPVCHAEGRWLVSRYRDCEALLSDPNWAQVDEDLTMCLPDRQVAEAGEGDAAAEPHNPRYLRALLADEFSPAALRRLRPKVQALVDGLLDDALAAGEVDLVETFAHPLPALVICELFGVPASDREVFSRWVEDIVRRVDIVTSLTPEDVERHDRARAEFRDYFRWLIGQRRERGGDDLLSALVRFEDHGRRLTEEELLDACIFVLIAGHGAPTELLGLGVLALSRFPDKLARWRADPSLTPTAVEELLRYDAPSQIAPRMALGDCEVGGHEVRAGDVALLLLGAANRDPEAFAAPDELDLARRPNPHLGYGHGAHYCAGAPVARLELRVAFETLVRRAPRLEVTGAPSWKPVLALRGPAALPVRLR